VNALGCLKRVYILIKRHVEEIALERPLEVRQRKNDSFLVRFRKNAT